MLRDHKIILPEPPVGNQSILSSGDLIEWVNSNRSRHIYISYAGVFESV